MSQVTQQTRRLKDRLVLWRLAQVVLAIVVVGLTAKALSTSLEVELESSNKERSNTDSYTEKPSGVEWQPWRPSTYAEPEITSIGSHFESFHPFRGRKLAMARAPTWSSRQLQAITSKAKFEMEITPGEAVVPLVFAIYTFIYACTLMDWTRRRQRHYNSGKRITSYTIDIILDFISIGMWLSMVVITAIALSQRSKSAIQVDNVDDLVVDYAMTDSSLKALCAMCALLLVTSGLACHDSVSMKAQCAVPPAAPQDAGKNSECPVSLELTLNVS